MWMLILPRWKRLVGYANLCLPRLQQPQHNLKPVVYLVPHSLNNPKRVVDSSQTPVHRRIKVPVECSGPRSSKTKVEGAYLVGSATKVKTSRHYCENFLSVQSTFGLIVVVAGK